MERKKLEVKILSKTNNIPLYQSSEASGCDLKASLDSPMYIEAGRSALVPTGIFLEIPVGYEAQVRPRSGLALKHSITVLNTPGTIDSDYRGEIKVVLINHGLSSFEINDGDRIAQIVFAPIIQANFTKVDSLEDSSRGDKGFGSTGV